MPWDVISNLFTAFFSEKMFSAIILALCVIWFVRRDKSRDNKLDKIQERWESKLDAMRKEERQDRDKSNAEMKEIVHNYYNATGSIAASTIEVAKSFSSVADNLEDLKNAVDAIRMKESIK